jgi:hypothetical protein
MAHAHPVDENIDLPAIHAIQVQQALVTVQGVEAKVSLVTERVEQLLHPGSLFRRRDEIEVAILPLEGRLPCAGRVEVDSGAADELDRNSGRARRCCDALGLGDDVGRRQVGSDGQLRSP